MAKILIFEPETRYRLLLRYILEGVGHRVEEAATLDDFPLLAAAPPDLLVLGVHLGEDPGQAASPDWQLALPEVPVLFLFSGPAERRKPFLEAWEGPKAVNSLAQPVEPYPFLAMVKNTLAAPETWRRGGQHIV
jgi:DNA-binding response OmpR family regulator